jgi:nitrite reductase/ring-hydroxylating ferredoxin subunit
MKKTFLIFSFLLLLSCSKDKFNNNNPNLPNYQFSMDVDTNLPLYTIVTNPGNGIRVYPANGPSRGVIIFNTGTGYKAYDGSCPNHGSTSTCSELTLNGGGTTTCTCNTTTNEVFNLFTGLAPNVQYPLKEYRTETMGNIIRVYN